MIRESRINSKNLLNPEKDFHRENFINKLSKVAKEYYKRLNEETVTIDSLKRMNTRDYLYNPENPDNRYPDSEKIFKSLRSTLVWGTSASMVIESYDGIAIIFSYSLQELITVKNDLNETIFRSSEFNMDNINAVIKLSAIEEAILEYQYKNNTDLHSNLLDEIREALEYFGRVECSKCQGKGYLEQSEGYCGEGDDTCTKCYGEGFKWKLK